MLSACELLVGHVEGVEHDSAIRLNAEARLRPLNARVECQMVDLSEGDLERKISL